MLFNLVCALLVALLGSPVRIYIFSNVGYLFAIIVALFGYFFVRQFRKDQISPFRLHAVFRWIALVMAAFLTFVYIAGGWGSPDIVVGSGQGPLLFILGLVVLGAYWPLYLWRARTDRRDGLAPLEALPGVPEEPAAVDSDEIKEPRVLDPARG